MASYRLSFNAKDDLYRIWAFGVSQFGEAQADAFVKALFQEFARIAAAPEMFPEIPEIKAGYRKCVYKSVGIYFRSASDAIEVMALIGMQDTSVWLG